MKINRIEIKNFRNIENIDASFDDVNIIYGENAQGKTNFIEAVYLFTGAKSFRENKDSRLVKFGCDESKLSIEFESGGRKQNSQIIINKKRTAILNGVKKNSPTLLGDEIKAVIFSPQHLSLIKDGPSQRRKFVDRALCQIKSGYANLLKEYSRSLLQRNTLLNDISLDSSLKSMLYVWDRNVIKTGAKIIYQRQKYIQSLMPFAENIFEGLTSSRENIEIFYEPQNFYGFEIEDIETSLEKSLKENLNKDILNKTTSSGPHRDDIEILINKKNARLYGSQGQQRSCVLAIKLAEADLLKEKTMIEPVAILDDVMSELDEKRQDYILNNIKDRQVFITCCDKETILRLKKGKTFCLNSGKIV